MELKKREDVDGLEGYYEVTTDKGMTFSVVDLGTTMASASDSLKSSGIFLGWEAIEIKDRNLNTNNQYRASTWEELEKQLNKIGEKPLKETKE